MTAATITIAFIIVAGCLGSLLFLLERFRHSSRHQMTLEDFDTLQKIYLSGMQAATTEQCLQIILESIAEYWNFQWAHVLKVKDEKLASSFHIWHHASRRLNADMRSLMEEDLTFDCSFRQPCSLSAHDGALTPVRQRFIEVNHFTSIFYLPLIVTNRFQYCIECYKLAAFDIKTSRAQNFFDRLQILIGPLLESIQNKQDLIAAKQVAQEASRVKSEFLAMMSHEIRTPLQGLLGMTKIIRDEKNNQEIGKYASMAFDSAHSLYSVINGVLDYSRIESGRFDIIKTPFDITQVVTSAIDNFSALARSKDLALSCHFSTGLSRELIGDKQRIWEVIVNLVSNAIKFTENGAIDVYVETMDAGDSNVTLEITIKDTGIGIPAPIQGQIFKTFVQGDHGLSRRHEGSGLGLAICRSLVDLMNGEIDFTSHVGEGSTFSIRLNLPKGTVNSHEKQTPSPQTFPQSQARVLLVEDNDVSRCYFEYLLDRMKISFVSCENGSQAIDELQRSAFDLVLLDCHLPKVTGFDVARYIRKNIDTDDVRLPIIAITGYVFKDDADLCDLVGVNDYIYKPVLEDEFSKKILQWLRIGNLMTISNEADLTFKNNMPAPVEITAHFDELDLSLLKKICEKHKPEEHDSIIRDVIDAFFKNTPDRVKELKEAIASGNTEIVWRRSHSIRTSAEIFGAKKLALACRDIEEAGRLAKLPSEEKTISLSEEFLKLENTLKRFREIHSFQLH